MTARHRKGKNNHKFEENSFRHDILDAESRGGNQYALLFILFLMIVIGGATVAWFCLQQHQTITYLADNLMGVQMKMVKLQTFQEEMRKTNEKLHSSEGFEHRLHALEEAYVQAQKQVGMALATAEQLKTSDLPTQVLSLHTEMKARLDEVQQSAVSLEQLNLLQGALRSHSEEFDAFKAEVAALAGASGDLTVTVEGISGGLATAESKLEEQAGRVGALASQLEGQTTDLLGLKEALALHKAQLEASSLEVVAVKELLETEEAQRAQLVTVEEQLSSVRRSLEEQNMVAQTLHSELKAQLHSIQSQVQQFEGTTTEEAQPEEHEAQATPAVEEAISNEPVQEDAPELVAAPSPEEEELSAAALEPSDPPVKEEELAAPEPEEVQSDQAVEEGEPPVSEEASGEQVMEEESAGQVEEAQALPLEEEVNMIAEELVGEPLEVADEAREEFGEHLQEEEQLIAEDQMVKENIDQTEDDVSLEQECKYTGSVKR